MINSEMKKQLDRITQEMRDAWHVPSIMLSVTRGGETFYCGGGIADIRTGAPADEHTLYAIASASKAFIATAICMLVDEGKLSLDQPVKELLPDFQMYDPYMTEHLTMRDAMSHRTGLPRHDITWYVHPELKLRDLVHILRYMEPAYAPRTRMHYQNHMFTLATVVVEELTGMPWNNFVEARILKPLGMSRTYCLPSQFRGKVENVAEPHAYVGGEIRSIPYADISGVGCAGCMTSTVHDLAIWARLQAGEGELDGKRYFSRERAADLHTPQMIIKPGEMSDMAFPEVTHTAYGLGWFIESYRGHTLVHHGGTIDGYKSIVGYLPGEDVSFAVLSNRERNQSPMALAYAVCDLALGLEPIDWTAKMSAELDRLAEAGKGKSGKLLALAEKAGAFEGDLSAYCGVYTHPAYGTLKMEEREGRLYGSLGILTFEVATIGGDAFIVDALALGIVPGVFVRDANGRVIEVQVGLEPDLPHYIGFKLAE
ncbi:MAG: serine hydrolase [Clostridia bacterium]|nr:serine hydrolase [Clostridia bacterium]